MNDRYERQKSLIGADGQQRLSQAKVLLVGLGGLGCPSSLYLAAAGIGTLGLADSDVVEFSNLHRQTLYTQADLKRPKAEAAACRLSEVSPSTHFNRHPRLTEANASIVAQYDLVIDGSDNLSTRYLLNDTCLKYRVPLIVGSVFEFTGQVAIFNSSGGACYRCLYPEAPPIELAPPCGQVGVVGVVPGMIGMLQSSEAIKFLLGDTTSMGKLMLWDATQSRLSTFEIGPNGDCVCRPKTQRSISGEPPMFFSKTKEISPKELKAQLDSGTAIVILDVREPDEFATANIGGKLIPLSELEIRYKELDPSQTIVALCHHGMRSRQAANFLRKMGYNNVANLTGGIDRWSLEVDDKVARY